jgi:hypothetical protein
MGEGILIFLGGCLVFSFHLLVAVAIPYLVYMTIKSIFKVGTFINFRLSKSNVSYQS